LLKIREPLDGNNTFIFQLVQFDGTGFDRFSVNQHGTGTAGAFTASVLYTGQMQFIPEVP